MIQFRARRALPGLGMGILALAILAVSGCARDRHYTSVSEGGTSRVVQRPVLNAPPGKPLYLGGYAGADYAGRGAGRRP